MDPNFPLNMNPTIDYLQVFDENFSLSHPQNPGQPQFQYQTPAQPYTLQQQAQPQHYPQSNPNFQHHFQRQSQPQPPPPRPQPYHHQPPPNYPQFYQNQNLHQTQNQSFQPEYPQQHSNFYQQPIPAQFSPQVPPQPIPQPFQLHTQSAPQAGQHFRQSPVQQQAQPRARPPPPKPRQHQSQSPVQPAFELIIPSQKHQSPVSHPQQARRSSFGHKPQPHAAGPISVAPQAFKQSPRSDFIGLPHVKQEHPPLDQLIPDQPLPTTVSLEQIQMKPIRPPTTMNPHQMHLSTPQGKSRILQAVEITTKPKQPITKPPEVKDTPVKLEQSEPEYPTLLLALADDYLDAARKLPEVTDEYQELVALALGCLESALANLKLQPLREAQTSLRYAQVLYEETENYDEAETQLTKAIEICERHKFIDLKYEIQLLLAKVLYQSKPKAALRDIQRMIDDIEAYHHTAWLYLFRFQHVMFSLASSSPGEVHGPVIQLEKIANLARQSSDSVILAFAAILEALLHLSSSGNDAVVSSQTALAKARALQLNPDVEATPQMMIMMEFIDLASSVQECNVTQTEQKRKILHDVLYDAIGHANWRDDGFIFLPISKRSVAGVHISTAGHITEKNGKHFLGFSWLLKEEVEALGFLFSADSASYKNGHDGKAEKYAKSGLALVRGWQQTMLSEDYEQANRAFITHKLMEAQFLFLLTFLQSARGRWQKADKTLTELSQTAEQLGDNFPASMKSGALYLKGVIAQGLGDLSAALAIYQSPTLKLVQLQNGPGNGASTHQISRAYHAESNATRNFSILAAMNSTFIIQNPRHPHHNQLSSLLNAIAPAAQSSGNKHIEAHYSLLVSVLSTTTLTVKQYLKSAMDAGRATGSAMTTALALIYMQQKMFKGTVDEQALKCARAATHQARRWGEPMWTHVAAGLEAESLEVNGLLEEAAKKKQEAQSLWGDLPDLVKSVKGT